MNLPTADIRHPTPWQVKITAKWAGYGVTARLITASLSGYRATSF